MRLYFKKETTRNATIFLVKQSVNRISINYNESIFVVYSFIKSNILDILRMTTKIATKAVINLLLFNTIILLFALSDNNMYTELSMIRSYGHTLCI